MSMKEWLKSNRTLPLCEILTTIKAKVRGHYQYYGVTDNAKAIKKFQCADHMVAVQVAEQKKSKEKLYNSRFLLWCSQIVPVTLAKGICKFVL